MKRYILFLIFFECVSGLGYSQVGIGTTTPQAALDVSGASGGGILVPRFALTGSDDGTTVINPATGAPGLLPGTLIYNTTTTTPSTAPNAIDAGFKYWDGTQWQGVERKTGIMFRTFTAGGVGGSGTVFNFPNDIFNNIPGASFGGTGITLPRGVYVIESNLRLNSNNTIDWAIRLNGAEIPGSVRGSQNPPNFNTNAAETQLVAVFEITAATGVIDFQVVNGPGAAVIGPQCYVKIEKVN